MTDRQSRGKNHAQRSGELQQRALDRRRISMQSAEGHAGSVPRGNPEPEEESIVHHRDRYERVLGH